MDKLTEPYKGLLILPGNWFPATVRVVTHSGEGTDRAIKQTIHVTLSFQQLIVTHVVKEFPENCKETKFMPLFKMFLHRQSIYESPLN